MSTRSFRPLNIRYLKTTYGEFVDLQERVVGDLFDDRGADGNIRNSILEVHRYPPSPDELQTLQRFSSLAPTSSARPKKRPLEMPSQSYHSQTSQDAHRVILSIEEGDAETERPFGTAAKRPRMDDPRLYKRIAADQSLAMSKEHGGGPHQSSQTSGTQESIHQVPDSQRSPRKKRTFQLSHLSSAAITCQADPNPYGTPTSLALIGSQESLPANEIDLSAIPDSPLGREAISVNRALEGAIGLDRGRPKAESPELRASVHEVPPTDPVDASGKQPTTSATSPKPSTPPFIFNSASQPTSIPQSISQIVDRYVERRGQGIGQLGQNASDINRNPNRTSPIADPAHAQTARSNTKISHNSDPIFDPIESDTESFNEKQQMQNAKRLRSSKKSTASITSPCASNEAEADRRDSQFPVSSVPQPSINGACIPSWEANAPGQRENIQMSSEDLKAASMNAQDDVQQHDATSPENQQSESCNTEPDKASREAPSKGHGRDDLTSTAKTSSQATTDWSQDSVEPIDGTGITVDQKPDERISRQEPESDKTTGLGHDANDVVRNSPKKARAKEEELAEAKRTKETRINAARLADEKTTSERLAREQQNRETALAEEADKLMLVADGAKSIQAEKREKEKAKRMGTMSSNIGPKRSMTPLVPEITDTKSSSHQTPSGSSPASNPSSGKTGSLNAPLRSALRQTPSALRRSVSSVSFDVRPRTKLNEYIPSTTASKASSKALIQIPLPTTASKGKPTKTPAKNGKVQTKLNNVTVQSKKLKGRVFNLPTTSMPAPKQEIVLSSGEDSSTSEEPKWQSGNAKAGPSSRKPMFRGTTSQGKKTAEVKRPGTHIDPNIRNIKVEKDRTGAPAAVSRSTPDSNTTSLQKSNPRSPALALSARISLSSGSASSSDSGLASGDSDSGSDSEEKLYAASPKTLTGVTNGKVAPGTMKGSSKAVNLGTKQLQGNVQSKGPSQPSRASSTGSCNTVTIHGDSKPVNRAADKSQLESRNSVSRSSLKQSTSNTSSVPDDKVINQGLNHAGRLPNGIRPAYYRYPTLTELEKLPRSVTPPDLGNCSSQPREKSPLEDFGSDDSSSESDDSSSTSDEDQESKGVASLTSSKKTIWDYPGMKQLMRGRPTRP